MDGRFQAMENIMVEQMLHIIKKLIKIGIWTLFKSEEMKSRFTELILKLLNQAIEATKN